MSKSIIYGVYLLQVEGAFDNQIQNALRKEKNVQFWSGLKNISLHENYHLKLVNGQLVIKREKMYLRTKRV